MRPLPESIRLAPGDLPQAASDLRVAGWRLVTGSCVPHPDGWTVLFHFERDERLRHLRVEVARGQALPAIDHAYPAAFLVENEMKELQGLPVTGLSIDYEGRLFRDFDGPEGFVHEPPRIALEPAEPYVPAAAAPPAEGAR